jgi:hypothetical protein
MYKQKLYDLNMIHQQLNNILINLGLARISKNKSKSSKGSAKKGKVAMKPVKKGSSIKALSSKTFYGL